MARKKSTPPRIFELRTTWIWFEAIEDLLTGAPPKGTLGGRVATEVEYDRTFRATLEGRSDLTLPWVPGKGRFSRFWTSYLDKTPEQVSDRTAWRNLVPLRLAIPVLATEGGNPVEGTAAGPTVRMEGLTERMRLEALLYPHGVGLIGTVHVEGDYELGEAVRRLIEVRDHIGARFEGDEGQPYRLLFLAQALLDELQNRMAGGAKKSIRSEAFTVSTVVRGSWPKPKRPKHGDPVHKALECLCIGSTLVDEITPSPLGEHLIAVGDHPPSHHVHYGLDRGRAVWFPSHFNLDIGQRSKLGCYHRNLVMLTVQVEAALGLMNLADARRGQGSLPSRYNEIAKHAANLLGRLYGGAETYRSESAVRQIEAGGGKERIERVRKALGISEAPLTRDAASP